MNLIGPGDPAPFERVRPDSERPILIIADHAGRCVPEAMRNDVGPLGLPASAFDEHIALDIGVDGVARGLSARLGACAIIARYSRLIIDLNRALGDPACIAASSDGTPLVFNHALSQADIEARARSFYWPYHDAIDLALAGHIARGAIPLLLSVHSFTPSLRSDGKLRPWQAGVMASADRRFADLLLGELAAAGISAEFNQPYSGITHGYCVKRHGLARGIPHLQLEIRQDLIGDAHGQAEWADRVAKMVDAVADDPGLRCFEHH